MNADQFQTLKTTVGLWLLTRTPSQTTAGSATLTALESLQSDTTLYYRDAFKTI
jgi:hypothetical protein